MDELPPANAGELWIACGDALGPEAAALYAKADVLLCMCTAFSAQMMAALAESLTAAKPGSYLITATVLLPSAGWAVRYIDLRAFPAARRLRPSLVVNSAAIAHPPGVS